MATRPDPFGQIYQNFVDFFRELDQDTSTRSIQDRIPRVCVFKISDLQRLINLADATKIAFYPMPHIDDQTNEALMIAVAYKDGSIPPRIIRIEDIPYVVAEHNCPPQCLTDPFGPP